MICQTNDVSHNKEVRSRFISLQNARMLEKARCKGGGLVDCTPEENLEMMVQVMSDKSLHLQASAAYKHTGTTVALDGTEDEEIRRGCEAILG